MSVVEGVVGVRNMEKEKKWLP